MRILLTLAAYIAALLVVAAVAFVVVLVLAGPHAGLLPHALEVAVLILGWLSIAVVPVWVAWIVWRRTGRTAPSAPGRG